MNTTKTKSPYKLIANVLSNYGRDIVDVIIFLFLIPFIINTLGKETFGLWSFIWAFVSLFSLLDFGFGPSVVKYISDARGKNDSEKEQKVISTLFFIYCALGFVLFVCTITCVFFFDSIFDIPQEHQQTAHHVFIILGIRAALSMPFEIFRGVLISHHKYSVTNIYKIGANILYFVAALVLLTIIPDLRILALLNLLLAILPLVAMFIHLRCTNENFSIHPKNFDRHMLPEMTSFSLYFFLVQLSAFIYTRVDTVIIQKFLSLEMVALYTISMKITEKANRFCTQITKTLTPVIAELHSADQREKLMEFWFQGSKLTVALTMPLLLGLFLLAQPLIVSWAGIDFAQSTTCCQLLTLAVFISIIHSNSHNILTMCGEQKYFAKVTIWGQMVNLVLSIVLISYFFIEGVAFATLVSNLIIQIIFVQRKACRMYNINIFTYYSKILFPSALATLCTFLFIKGGMYLFLVDTLYEVAFLEIFATIVFFVIFWVSGLNANEKHYVKNILRKKKKKG